MDRSFEGIDRKPEASAGKHWQAGMPFMAEVPPLHMLEPSLLARVSFSGCLVAAAQNSGKDDWEIADEIHISHGYMSRFMRGIGQQWARRMIAFMRSSHSLAPLQYIANEMGCDVVVRSTQAARIAELQAELANLTRRAA